MALFLLLLLSVSLPSVLAVSAATLSCNLTASVSDNGATFSGSISGGSTPYSWTLTFGDGASISGSAATFSTSHAYTPGATYTATLNVQSGGISSGPQYASCSTRVKVPMGYSVNVNETMGEAETAALVPPIDVNEGAAFTDHPGLIGPGGYNESAAMNDVVTVTKGSNSPLSFILGNIGVVAIGVAGLAGAGLVIWKLVLPRLAGGLGRALQRLNRIGRNSWVD